MEQLENELRERIGIDRSVVFGFDIERISSRILYAKIDSHVEGRYVDLALSPKSPVKMDNGEGISRLTIKDKQVGMVTIKYDQKADEVTNKLKLTISSDGNNLQNLSASEYQQRVQEVFSYLDLVYGITADYDNLRIKELELNATFFLAEKYEQYKDPILMIMRNAPAKRFSDNGNNLVKYATWYQANLAAQEDKLETALIKNKSIELKIYNKSRWLKDKHYFPLTDNRDLMRIEYRIMDSRLLQTHFGDNLVTSLSDNKINEMYKKYFIRDVIEPWKKWHEKNLEELTEMAQRHRIAEKHWVSFFLREARQYTATHGFPVLFDLADMRQVFKRMGDGKNAGKKYKRFLSQAIYERDLLGNTGRMEEIINKIMNL